MDVTNTFSEREDSAGSKIVLLYVATGYPAKKMVHIPKGVDTARSCSDQAARVRVREEWRGTQKTGSRAWSNGLIQMKGDSTFLAAASRLARRDSCIKFVCVGHGPAILWC